MIDTKHWIVKIVPVLSFAAGVIMSAIGGTMVLSSTAKLAFFDQSSYFYASTESCRLEFEIQDPTKSTLEEPRVRTQEEIDACLLEQAELDRSQFRNSEKQDIVDGLSSTVVGLLLIFFFRRGNKK